MTSTNDKILIHEQKKNLRQVRWLIFWVLISINVVSLSTAAIFSFIQTTVILDYMAMAAIHILAVMLPLIIYFKTIKPDTKKINLRRNKFTIPQGLIIIILAAAGQFIMAISNVPIQMLRETQYFPAPLNNVELLIGIIVIAIIPAILEELLFRGIIFGISEQNSKMFAVIFSTFVFALLHSDIFVFPGLLFLGIMTVVVMIRTNSIYAAMLYHFINNAATFLVSYLVHQGILATSASILFIFTAAIVVFIVGIFIFQILTPNAPKYKEKPPMQLVLKNIFSIPIILCIAITIFIQFFNPFM